MKKFFINYLKQLKTSISRINSARLKSALKKICNALIRLAKFLKHKIVKSWIYSYDGLKAAFREESSIKIECIIFFILLAILLPTPWPLWKKIALIASYLLIPLTELINSALENICDLVSHDFNMNIKKAKDQGSAAVLLAIIINIMFLIVLILI